MLIAKGVPTSDVLKTTNYLQAAKEMDKNIK